MKSKIRVSVLAVIILQIGCTLSNGSSSEGGEKLQVQSVSQIKEIVAKHILENEYYQQYYSTDSKKFDSRVKEIAMVEPILVKNLSPSMAFPNDYYVVYGVILDGQLMAAEAIDAYTGNFIEGKVWIDDVETRLITVSEANAYSRAVSSKSSSTEIVPVFVQDASVYAVSPLLSWKYATSYNQKSRSLAEYSVLVDPFVKGFRQNNVPQANNAYMSTIGFFHRAYRLNSEIARNGTDGKAVLEPID